MGTRHLIAVYQGGTHKIAQYGQWDGYPSGQGKDILAFLHDESAVHLLKTYRLKNCQFLTSEEAENMQTSHSPQLSRNMGAKILDLAACVDSLALVDCIEFAADSLFCEWAYVIDFDQNVFEVYRGFNTKPAIGRFKDMPTEPGSEYQPVTLLKSYSLDDLPSFEQFITDCEPTEEE